MTNNDVLRRLRYALELDNLSLLACFRAAGRELDSARLAAFLKEEDEAGFVALADAELAALLDGLIIKKRGPRDEAPNQPAELTNNRILRALKIALTLKDTDVLDIMELAETPVSKTELSALFRREDHRNYQPCGDQFLRGFLKGLGVWHRQSSARRA